MCVMHTETRSREEQEIQDLQHPSSLSPRVARVPQPLLREPLRVSSALRSVARTAGAGAADTDFLAMGCGGPAETTVARTVAAVFCGVSMTFVSSGWSSNGATSRPDAEALSPAARVAASFLASHASAASFSASFSSGGVSQTQNCRRDGLQNAQTLPPTLAESARNIVVSKIKPLHECDNVPVEQGFETYPPTFVPSRGQQRLLPS